MKSATTILTDVATILTDVESTDLAVKLVCAGLIGLLAGLPLAFEEIGSVLQQLALPGTDHGGVNLETGGNFGCGLVTLEGSQSNFGLE
jgi:hypothetical protein